MYFKKNKKNIILQISIIAALKKIFYKDNKNSSGKKMDYIYLLYDLFPPKEFNFSLSAGKDLSMDCGDT